jgi:hypothetical protein
MPHYIASAALDRPLWLGVFGHAGGMKAISRRLSAATPPEPHANQNASQRDASLRRVRRGRIGSIGPLAGIPSGCGSFSAYTGGVAGAQPPANRCDASGIKFLVFSDMRLYARTLSTVPAILSAVRRKTALALKAYTERSRLSSRTCIRLRSCRRHESH